MEILSANEAKTHFGDLLLKVQREPIQINRNGKAVAVVLSIEDFQELERLKLQQLQIRVEQAQDAINQNETVEGDILFNEVLTGKFD